MSRVFNLEDSSSFTLFSSSSASLVLCNSLNLNFSSLALSSSSSAPPSSWHFFRRSSSSVSRHSGRCVSTGGACSSASPSGLTWCANRQPPTGAGRATMGTWRVGCGMWWTGRSRAACGTPPSTSTREHSHPPPLPPSSFPSSSSPPLNTELQLRRVS